MITINRLDNTNKTKRMLSYTSCNQDPNGLSESSDSLRHRALQRWSGGGYSSSHRLSRQMRFEKRKGRFLKILTELNFSISSTEDGNIENLSLQPVASSDRVNRNTHVKLEFRISWVFFETTALQRGIPIKTVSII